MNWFEGVEYEAKGAVVMLFICVNESIYGSSDEKRERDIQSNMRKSKTR